ncbi:MAG: hypothetical protein AB8B51_12085 [Sedimentitalea sp.]
MRNHFIATAATLVLLGAPMAQAQEGDAPQTSRPSFWQVFTIENFATGAVQSLLGTARVLADIKYDQISVDPVALRVTLTGVDIAPLVPGLESCAVRVERMTLKGNAIDRIGQVQFHAALDGLNVAPGCLPPEPAQMAKGMGFERLRAERADVTIRYDYASGGGEVLLTTDLERLAAVTLEADIDYFSYRMDFATEEPVVAFDLNALQLTLRDKGGWDLAKSFVPANMLNPDVIKQIVSSGAQTIMRDANGPTQRDLTPAQRSFALAAGNLASGFDAGRRQIVLATRIENGPYRISEATLEESFAPFFDRLNPSLSEMPLALNRAIPVAALDATLNNDAKPDDPFAMGAALITGLGAPRNVSAGIGLLLPLARGGNAQASMLIAEAIADINPKDAYSHALRTASVQLPGSLALLDRLERRMSYEDIIAEQNALMNSPDASLYNDLAAMRSAARGFLTGTTRPRSFRAAYYWASMAAAAGDGIGADLRDEVTELMRLRGDGAAWAEETRKLDNGVLRDWIGRNVPDLLR